MNPVNIKSKVSCYHFNEAGCTFEEDIPLKQCAIKPTDTHVNWVNIVGIEDNQTLQEAMAAFQIHPLVAEDIKNPNQRAKVEDYGDMLYIVLRMFVIEEGEIRDQQVSLVLRNNLLVTFREADFGIFKKLVGDKLIAGTGGLRKKGEDYLLYTLLDIIIDHHYFVLEHVNAQIEKLEREVFQNPQNEHLLLFQRLKSDMLYMRRHILPVRDLIQNLSRFEVTYFDAENKYYLRDIQDHTIRNTEELDFQREQLSGLADLYYSLQNHKMNNIMKTLTGLSFVLLPLNFIASLYGMNFSYIPHSEDKFGFWEVIAIMAAMALILTYFAFRRNWLSTKDFESDFRD